MNLQLTNKITKSSGRETVFNYYTLAQWLS